MSQQKQVLSSIQICEARNCSNQATDEIIVAISNGKIALFVCNDCAPMFGAARKEKDAALVGASAAVNYHRTKEIVNNG